MAGEEDDNIWDTYIIGNLDCLCKTIDLNDKFKLLFPDDVLGKQHWEQIMAQGQSNEGKVDRFLDILRGREVSKVYPILSHALWRTNQVSAAQVIDPFKIFKSRTLVWFCMNEYQAHAVISTLWKYAEKGLARTTRVPKTISLDEANKQTYCKIEATISDGRYECIQHRVVVVYLASSDENTVPVCVRDINRRFLPRYVLHTAPAVSKASPSSVAPVNALPVGSVIVPTSIGGVSFLSEKIFPEPCAVQSFCKHKNSPPILEAVLSEWGKVESFSSLLGRCSANVAAQQQQPDVFHEVDPQALFSAEQAGLGKVGVVGHDDRHPHSFSFVPSDSLLSLAHAVSNAQAPGPQVYSRSLTHPKRDGEVFPKCQGTFAVMEAWSTCFNRQHQRIVCVNTVSSVFAGLNDFRTENIAMQLAAVVALDIVCSRLERSRADQEARWSLDLSMKKLSPQV